MPLSRCRRRVRGSGRLVRRVGAGCRAGISGWRWTFLGEVAVRELEVEGRGHGGKRDVVGVTGDDGC